MRGFDSCYPCIKTLLVLNQIRFFSNKNLKTELYTINIKEGKKKKLKKIYLNLLNTALRKKPNKYHPNNGRILRNVRNFNLKQSLQFYLRSYYSLKSIRAIYNKSISFISGVRHALMQKQYHNFKRINKEMGQALKLVKIQNEFLRKYTNTRKKRKYIMFLNRTRILRRVKLHNRRRKLVTSFKKSWSIVGGKYPKKFLHKYFFSYYLPKNFERLSMLNAAKFDKKVENIKILKYDQLKNELVYFFNIEGEPKPRFNNLVVFNQKFRNNRSYIPNQDHKISYNYGFTNYQNYKNKYKSISYWNTTSFIKKKKRSLKNIFKKKKNSKQAINVRRISFPINFKFPTLISSRYKYANYAFRYNSLKKLKINLKIKVKNKVKKLKFNSTNNNDYYAKNKNQYKTIFFSFSRSSFRSVLFNRLKKKKTSVFLKSGVAYSYYTELGSYALSFKNVYNLSTVSDLSIRNLNNLLTHLSYIKSSLIYTLKLNTFMLLDSHLGTNFSSSNYFTLTEVLSDFTEFFHIYNPQLKIKNVFNFKNLVQIRNTTKFKNMFTDFNQFEHDEVSKPEFTVSNTLTNSYKMYNKSPSIAHYCLFLREYMPLKKFFKNNYLSDLGYRRFLNNPTFQINKYSRNLSLNVSKIANFSETQNSLRNLYNIILSPYYDFSKYLLSNKFYTNKKIKKTRFNKNKKIKKKYFKNLNYKLIKAILKRSKLAYFISISRRLNIWDTRKFKLLKRRLPKRLRKKSRDKLDKFMRKNFKSQNNFVKHRNIYRRITLRRIFVDLNFIPKKKYKYKKKRFINKRYLYGIKSLFRGRNYKTKTRLLLLDNFYLKSVLTKKKSSLKQDKRTLVVDFRKKRKTFFFTNFKKLTKDNKFSFYLKTTNYSYSLTRNIKSYDFGSLKNFNNFFKSRNLKNFNIISTNRKSNYFETNFLLWDCADFSSGLTNGYVFNLFINNPFIFKLYSPLGKSLTVRKLHYFFNYIYLYFYKKPFLFDGKINLNLNLIPNKVFSYRNFRRIINLSDTDNFVLLLTPWYHNTVIRFLEFFSGRKVVVQFYHSLSQNVDFAYVILYRLWLPRVRYYERKLGHRFFLEESIHIMHLAFFFKDVKLFMSWLKSLIQRISFWRTRSIFRFIKYFYQHYFSFAFPLIGLKGIKIQLKGKISAAGNSRKRTVFYKWGYVSHSSVNLKVLYDFETISTFTGVQGLQVWLFY